METFITPITPGIDIYDLRVKIGKKVASDRLQRPLRKKDLVFVNDIPGGHVVMYNGIVLGHIKDVDQGLLFEPYNPGYEFHSIGKGGPS